MAESELSISYDDLMKAVGLYLGYGGDKDDWNTSQKAEIDLYVQSGVRQFYYPPAVEGVENGHSWTFLYPTTTLVTVASTSTVNLPNSLGRILGDLTFEPELYNHSIVLVSEAQLSALMSGSDDAGIPRYAAVRDKPSDGFEGQRKQIVLWPVPNAIFTLTYRFEAYQGKLKDDFQYPLGGMKYAELATESCLAIAEQRANDEKGIHWDAFSRLLIAGVLYDNKNGARYYGAMGGNSNALVSDGVRQTSYDITYKEDTW